MEPTGTFVLLMTASLAIGLGAGWVMHRSDFCLAGMFRDFVLFRRGDMLRQLFLLVLVTMCLFEAARLLGLLPIYPFPLLYAPTAANIIGGFLFGIGMVLAGGCVVGTLYKMGAGSVTSMLAFVGLVAGSAAYAEIFPFWVRFIKATTFLDGRITIPQILGLAPTLPVLLVVGVGAVVLRRWARSGSLVRNSPAAGYLQPWKAAILLAVMSLASYLLTGMPLGVTSSYAKFAAYIERAVAPAHVDASAFFQAVPLNYIHPVTGAALEGGTGAYFDSIAAIQFPLVAGIVLGALLSAATLGELRVHRNVPARQLISAFVGGILLAFASRMAPTCNVWHLMGGLPVLAASSLLFFAALFPGAWVGSRLLTAFVVRTG